MKNKHKAIQDVVLNDVILKRKTELEQLRSGLNSPFRILDFLKEHPNIPISMLLPSPDDIKYDSDDVKHKLKSVSQGNDAEKQAFGWLLQYLDEISQAKGNSNSTLYVKQYNQKCDIQYITGLVYIQKNNSQETLRNVQNVGKDS